MRAGDERLGYRAGKMCFAALFLLGGLGHFIIPEVYLKIMPPALPAPRLLVAVSGLAELALGGLLLVPRLRVLAGWGLIALLIAVFPANVFMWQHAERFAVPAWVLAARLPLQAVLIAWAWAYTRPRRPATSIALVATLAMTSLAGCGAPSLPRFDRGALVRAESLDGKPLVVFYSAGEETVPTGTLFKVVADEEGTTKQAERKVIVGFRGGPHDGYAALMRRRDLQPDR